MQVCNLVSPVSNLLWTAQNISSDKVVFLKYVDMDDII